MFLDEKLYSMVENADMSTPDKINELYADLCGTCQDDIQSKIRPFMPKSEVKAIIKRQFYVWDSFVLKLSKSKNKAFVMFADILREHSFKDAYLSHPAIKSVYDSL